MFSKARYFILLLCITSCIYILRSNHTSPTTFLHNQAIQATRLLQGKVRPSISLCKGVDIKSDVTAEDKARADDFKSALDGIRDGNPFVDFIEGPAPASAFDDDYIVPVIKFAVPWIVFFGLSIIACVLYLFTWCCCRHSKSDRFKNFCFILGMFFLVGVIGASIAGLVVSQSFPKGGHRAICKASLLFEELAYGDSTDKWIGIQPAADKVIQVLDIFDATVDSLETIDDDFTEMRARIQPALDAVQRMYDDNANKVVQTRPDPNVGGDYVPLYIQNLGPVSNLTTATGTLQLEMTAKQIAVEEASNAVNIGISELRQNRRQYQQDLNQGRDFAVATSTSIDTVLAKVKKFGNDANHILDQISGALLGIFIADLIVAIFAILMILIVCCGIKFFNKCVHLSWCTLGIIGILTWGLSAVVFPLSLILFEGCEVADRIISDPEFFDITFDKFIGSNDANVERAKQVVHQCLFEDGELLAVFGLEGKVDMFDPIFNALDSTANLTETVQAVPDSIAIPLNQELITSFRNGLQPDSIETGVDLAKLNGYITATARQCGQIQDVWVLNSAQCPASAGSVFGTGSAPAFNLRSPTCIGFNTWGDKDIEDRYSATTLPEGSCGTANEYLTDFVNRFVDSRQEVQDIFDDLQTSLDNVATANTAFMASVKAITRRFDPIRNDTLTVYNLIANHDTGLLYNTNCLFIKDSVHTLHDSLCVEAISSLFQTMVDILVLSFMAFFATFFVFCLTRKFSMQQRNEGRQSPENYQPKAY